jgi:hypothetical protein
MHEWTHQICIDCWNKKEPKRPIIQTIEEQDEEACCFCGTLVRQFLFIRHSPKALDIVCRGNLK